MKMKNLLALGAVIASGLTLASCDNGQAANDKVEVTAGVGYAVDYTGTTIDETKTPVAITEKSQADVTVAFAAFDKDGKIVDARFDVVQVTVKTDADGVWTETGTKTNDNGIKSKLELGADYNMLNNPYGGSTMAEVDTQIESFADWTIGKTVAEVKESIIPGSGHGVAVAEDLTGKVTISVDAFVKALDVAYEMKQDAGSVAKTAKAGVGIVTETESKSTGSEANGDLVANAYAETSVTVAGALMDGTTVAAAQIDTVVIQFKKEAKTYGEGADAVAYNDWQVQESKYYADGKYLSKAVLKEAYAMAGRATKGEWYVQVDNMEKYIVGKTVAAVKGEVAEDGKADTTKDLAGTITMTVSPYINALEEAANYAALEHVGPQH